MDNARKNVAKLRRIRYLKEAATDTTGVTNQATVLNTFLASLPVGTEVRGAPGEIYGLSAQVLIGVSGIKLVGNGAIFRKLSGSTQNTLIRINATKVEITDLELDGLNATTADGVILNASVCTGFTMRKCVIYNCQYGASLMSNSKVTFDDNDVSLCERSCVRVHNNTPVSGVKSWRVTRNRFDQSAANPATLNHPTLLVRGDEADPTEDVEVSGNRFFLPANPTNSEAMGCEIRWCIGPRYFGNYVEDGAMMVSVAGCAGGSVTGNTGYGQNYWSIEVAGPVSGTTGTTLTSVTGNTIDGLGRCLNGIGMQGSAAPIAGASCVASGNAIKGVKQTSIYVSDTWDRVAIGPNVIEMVATADTNRAIWVKAEANDISINPGVLYGDGSTDRAIQLNDTVGFSITGGVIAGWAEGLNMVAGSSGSINSGVISGVTFRSVTTPITTSGAGTLGSSIQVRGCPGYTRSGAEGQDVLDYLNDVIDAWGTATPEAAVTAGVGSIFRRRDGGAGTTLYVKQSGTGNTGWAGK